MDARESGSSTFTTGRNSDLRALPDPVHPRPEESGQRLSDAGSPCQEMQDAAHSTVEITSEMVEAAALVLEHRFDSSQGIAAIVAEDL